MNFEKYAAKGNEFLKEVARELGEPDNRDRAGRVVRAVFHATRKTITPQESLQLVAQLPMILKAVYLEGWKLTEQKDKIQTPDAFLALVRREAGTSAGRDFGNDQKARKVVQAVWRVLTQHISLGETADIDAVLAEKLKGMFREAIGA